jgi:rhamnogalacturonyl hydrolase YesR
MHSDASTELKPTLENSIAGVVSWVEARNYEAYDPGDGNNSFLHALTFNHLFLERLLQQSVYRAPFNVRPVYGIKPHRSTKGVGYFAWGYLKMHALNGKAEHKERAVWCLDWLMRNKSPGYAHFSWGNHFPFCTRSGKTPALEPIVPWSALIGQAFLEAWRTLGEAKYLDVAASVAEWVMALPREKTATGDCISYVAFKQNSIHNSNMLAAALLGQIGQATNNPAALRAAQSAMQYSCSRQHADGAWDYGEAPKYHWIDNFHTGYNLDCLKRYKESTGDASFDRQRKLGFAYFKANFFEPDGRPKYYHNKTYPTDIQCAAQAIDTLAFFASEDAEALALAQRVALWTIEHMQDQDGHFYYRDLGWAMNKTPMLHWGQGTMFKALAHLLSVLSAATPTKPAGRALTASDLTK